ncbi:MAG: hypothetical protein EAZ91_13070 [Cytophagales bacterium]|nr:MAG: hypothetical protein EAZ91_13070 [Cytophagales bacterium]
MNTVTNLFLLLSLGLGTSCLMAQTPTYTQHIQPIIMKNCATPCHHPGGVGPFSLLTYEDVTKRGKFVAKVTQIRYMPPFPADRQFQHYANERGLSDSEIALIGKWVSGGMAVGSKQSAVSGKPSVNSLPTAHWQLPTKNPDLVLRMTKPYAIPGDGREDFRYFHIPTKLKEDVWLEAIEFVPGNRKLLHHSRLMVDTTGTMAGIDGMAEDDPRVAQFQRTPLADEFLYGWVPGNDRVVFPAGSAKRLRAGSDLIVNIHYAPSGKPDTDLSEVRLYFAKKPVTKPVRTLTLTENNISNQPFLIPANQKKSFFIQYGPLPDTVRLLSVLPHMHWLGKTVRAFAVTPEGDAINLIKIDDWNYNWQMTYFFRQPLVLPPGTVILAEANYDNTPDNPLNPNRPPRDVPYGWNSTNEMMNLVFYFTQ